MTENSKRNGRDALGRFTRGNAGGPGNPFGRQAEKFRATLMQTVTDDDIQAIARKLITEARAGDMRAASLLFDRVLGKVTDAPDMMDRIAQLEAVLGLEA